MVKKILPLLLVILCFYFFRSSFSSVRVLSDRSDSFSVVFTGDVMLGRSVNTQMHKRQDFHWPFRKISTILKDADIAVINLESPFNRNCPLTDTGMSFCASPSAVDGLVYSGVDIANLANNHIGNQGRAGFEFTKSLLSSRNITPIGLGTHHTVEIHGVKLAFLGFSDIGPVYGGVSSATPENIKSQISLAKSQSDIVLTTFHWGNEYSRHSKRQENLAHLAIDSGADVVVGHHPHWIQAIEVYKDKPIYYSLGNLVFDQMWSDPTRRGLILRLNFSGKVLQSHETFPIKIFNYGQPAIVENQ